MNQKIHYSMRYDGIHEVVRIAIIDTLNAEDVEDIIPEIEELLAGKPRRLLLFDLSQSGSDPLTKKARKSFKDNTDLTNYDKIAVYGATPMARMMAKVALSITGLSKISRFFKSEEDAVSWLKEDAVD